MRYKPDKKQSWGLDSSMSRPGRRSMTDSGGWNAGRIVDPSTLTHTMSERAWRNNFRPSRVSVKINDRWYSARVVVKAA
jgi:hypothetical protein